MCDQCLTFPCQDRCPNGREGEVPVCDFCGEPLLAGDAYLRFGQVRFCMDCAEGMTAREALVDLGAAEEVMAPGGMTDEEEW